MLQVTCGQFPPASLFTEFLGFGSLLECVMAGNLRLLLNAAVPSSPCGLQCFVFSKCSLVMSRILLDLPNRLISMSGHQWWAFSLLGLHHHHMHHIFPWKQAVLTAFQTWSGLGSVQFDLLLTGFWRSDRLLFSPVSVQLIGRKLQHLLMPSLSCGQWFLGSQGFLEIRSLDHCFWHVDALLSSGILFIPRQPIFGNAKVKFVAGSATSSPVENFPSGWDSCDLWLTFWGLTLLQIQLFDSQSLLLCLVHVQENHLWHWWANRKSWCRCWQGCVSAAANAWLKKLVFF